METLVKSMSGDHPARPVLVLSNKPGAGGLAKARALNVPTFVVDHLDFGKDRDAFDAAVLKALQTAKVDLVCLAGFMRILTRAFTDHWAGKMLNVHPSLLPKYKGLNTHARALAAGDQKHGCSVHQVTSKLDDGPILGQAQLDIKPTDTAETLAARVLPLEHALYPAVLRRFAAGNHAPVTLKY